MQNRRSGGKDTPVHGVGEGLLLGKAEAGARWCERRDLLGVRDGGKGKSAKDCLLRFVRVFTVGVLLLYLTLTV